MEMKRWMEANSPKELKHELDLLRNLPIEVVAAICQSALGLSPISNEARVLSNAAKLMDAQDTQTQPDYHNNRHTADVMLAFTRLAAHELKDPKEKALGLIAATLHDIGHPGGNNTHPYELEQQSVQLANRVLAPLGDDASKVKEAILATGFLEAGERVKKDYLSGGDKVAAVLRHADIFRSVYLTPETALDSGRKLQKEFMVSDRCPELRKAPFVKDMGGPKGQLGFLAMNPCYLQSEEGKRMETRRLASIASLEKQLRQEQDGPVMA